MKTLEFEIDVTSDRQLTIQLPEDIELGKHQIVLVMHPQEQVQGVATEQSALNDLAGKIQSFSGLDAVAWQRQVRDEWDAD